MLSLNFVITRLHRLAQWQGWNEFHKYCKEKAFFTTCLEASCILNWWENLNKSKTSIPLLLCCEELQMWGQFPKVTVFDEFIHNCRFLRNSLKKQIYGMREGEGSRERCKVRNLLDTRVQGYCNWIWSPNLSNPLPLNSDIATFLSTPIREHDVALR